MDLIKKNLDDMLKDRVYKFIETNTEGNYLIYTKKDNSKVVVYFTNDSDKIGVEYVKKVIVKTEEMEITHIILISKDKLTPFANKWIISYPIKMECFLLKELKFNITDHHLVPTHVLMSPKDSQEIIDYYGKKNLPQIKQRDVLSRYFDAEIGQVFCIHRNEGGIYYRLVTT